MFPNNNDFESEFTFENAATPVPEEPPFHILLLGNWSGKPNKKDLNERRPIVVDRDNFDDVIKKLNVGLELDWEDEVLSLQFRELDDFHPDNLYRSVPVFSDLRDIRRRLSDPDTFNSAAREVRSWFQTTPIESADSEIQSDINDAPPIESDNLLDMILAQPAEPQRPGSPQTVDKSELGRFVSNIVAPHLIKIDEGEQSNLISAVDGTISDLMRKILHHPRFQALESAWRGLYFLVRRVETDAKLKIFILDVSKDAFTGNLKAVENLSESFLYKRLVTEGSDTADGNSFAVIGGNYSFSLDVDDVASLMRIGKIANAGEAPFLSYLKPEIFGLEDFSKTFDSSQLKVIEGSKEEKLWSALRSSPEAGFIGLSPMKVLARMPYGNASDAAETFAFEEFTDTFEHGDYLWMNPCFVLILLLAQNFRLYGWQMRERLVTEVDGLPMPLFPEDGELKTKPAAEIVLTENSLSLILEQGLIPLVSFRDDDKIRLARLLSISSTMPGLNGKWNS